MGNDVLTFGTWYDFIVLAALFATGIYGIYEFFRLRKIRKIDNRFPDFVRDLAEARRAGMTFTKAIMYSAKGNYGLLTPEIKKISMQISWGSSVDNALNSFAKRVNTKLIRRTISLIIEASRSGGNVADVLDAASKDARELKLIESERRAGMLSYVAIIYVGMFVFLVIIIVLSKSLLPNMLSDEALMAGGGAVGLGGGGITTSAVTAVFFTAALVQSFGMGLVTGVFEEGNMTSGVKHIFVMLLICWLVFKIVVMGV
jgi:flagellar protein FlaJ